MATVAEQALYRKWRPNAFEEVVGQEHVVRTIQNALASGRAAHAYLFAGPRGTGKTTTARLVAKALNCAHPDRSQRPDNTCPNCTAVNEGRLLDLIEIDAASHTGVDHIRDLLDKINFAPSEGKYKVYVVDEVHMLSTSAFNALLKTLEEPPPHVVFILATTELHKVPLTVVSRCQKHTFRRIPATEIVKRLQAIVASEGLQVEPAVLEVLARQATGSLRDAISLLDQLVISPDDKVTLDAALAVLGTAAAQAVQDLVDALVARDSGRGLDLINTAIDNGADARQFARQMVDYVRGLMLIRLGNAKLVDVSAETRRVMEGQAAQLEVGVLLRAIKEFNAAAADQRSGWLAQLPLELAFVESLQTESGEAASLAAAGGVKQTMSPLKVPASPPAAPSPAKGASQSRPPAQSHIEIRLSQVAAKWKEIAAASRRHHASLQGLLNSCQPISIEGDVLSLGFESEVVLSKANTEANRDAIEKTIKEVLGAPLRVKCVVGVGGAAEMPDVNGDGPVAEAMRLGGRPRKK